MGHCPHLQMSFQLLTSRWFTMFQHPGPEDAEVPYGDATPVDYFLEIAIDLQSFLFSYMFNVINGILKWRYCTI